MPESASPRLHPLDPSSITCTETEEGVVVHMTTTPHQMLHPDGFVRTIPVSRWIRGPMHADDASVLVRIARTIGTESRNWAPVFDENEPKGVVPHDDPQGDFGDLFR